MTAIRSITLAGLAALALCACLASSASALTAYDQTNGVALAAGAAVTTTNVGSVTLAGTFFGISTTMTCTSSTGKGAMVSNGGSVVTGSITSATWSGCTSNLRGACTVTALNLPWTPSGNSGGVAATSTTSVGVAPGTTGAVDISNCVGATCTLTGGTASYGGLTHVMVGTWTNTVPQIGNSSTNLAPVNCSVTNATLSGQAKMTVDATGGAVGLR